MLHLIDWILVVLYCICSSVLLRFGSQMLNTLSYYCCFSAACIYSFFCHTQLLVPLHVFFVCAYSESVFLWYRCLSVSVCGCFRILV